MSNSAALSRRGLLIGAVGLATGVAMATPAGGGPWAVELFTSQGCSSCPPADALLGRLARRADIVALSFHVEYWDHIGWKDRFATRETTERQRAYARTLKQRYVYTPEMVVDGIGHDPGINQGPLDALLAEAARRSPTRATPELVRQPDGNVDIRLAAFKLERRPAVVTLAVYDRHHTTSVGQGENGGRTLENFNVVRHFELIGQWDGTAANWRVSPSRFDPGQGLAVLVQVADHGPMLGCSKLDPSVSG